MLPYCGWWTGRCFLSISSLAGAGAGDTEMFQLHALTWRSPLSLEGLREGDDRCVERDREAKLLMG